MLPSIALGIWQMRDSDSRLLAERADEETPRQGFLPLTLTPNPIVRINDEGTCRGEEGDGDSNCDGLEKARVMANMADGSSGEC